MENFSNPRPDFTLREIEIILCSKQNLSCQEIADKLFISISTVKKSSTEHSWENFWGC